MLGVLGALQTLRVLVPSCLSTEIFGDILTSLLGMKYHIWLHSARQLRPHDLQTVYDARLHPNVSAKLSGID